MYPSEEKSFLYFSVISVIEQTTGKKIIYEIIDEKLKKLSSKQIKANIKKHQNFDGLNEKVSNYIRKEGLYLSLTSTKE